MKKIAIAIFVVMLVGCGAPELDADYVIRPWIQMEDKGAVERLNTLVGWAVEADTTDWSVVSYEDALIGKVTHRTISETITSNEGGVKLGDEWSLNFHFTTQPIIIIVADTERPFYAYHQAVLYGGTPQTILSITEQAWRADTTIVEGAWRIVYGDEI